MMRAARLCTICTIALCQPAAEAQPQGATSETAGRPSCSPQGTQGQAGGKAAVSIAPYRYGDLLWENDRTAHRIYGEPLEAAEPPSSSGIDAWGKAVRVPFMERQLKGGDYHDDKGEGVDFFSVHATRGVGGLGIWHDNKLWTSRNYRRPDIRSSGPDAAIFQVEYDPWPVGVARKVWETRRFTLPLGTNFTRMVSTISSDKPGELVVGIGIAKHPTSTADGKPSFDRARGALTLWTPTNAKNGAMGLALLVDPATIVAFRQDQDNYLLLLREVAGKPFTYYVGAAWSKGLDFHSAAEWQAYVDAQRPDFDPAAPYSVAATVPCR